MSAGLMTDWITIDGSGTSPFVQDRSRWLDVARCGDVILWLEVRAVANPGADAVLLTYETSPTTDESLFMPLATSITLAASSTPVITKIRLGDDAANPLARWARWKAEGTAAGNWSITFRVLAVGGQGSQAWSPSSLSLTGWWRASYSGSPWTPTASAGSSGSNGNLTEATNPPAVGSAVNGLTPADCDGTNDILQNANAVSTFITTTAWSVWALVWVDAIAYAGAAFYEGDSILSDAWAVEQWGLHLGSNGGNHIYIYQWDGAAKYAWQPISLGAWQLIQAKYDGTNIKIRLNGGSWASTPASALLDASGVLCLGNDTFAPFNGKILEAGTAQTALSDATFDNIKSYVNARYALSL